MEYFINNRKKGFTLVEIMIVVAIIGLLAAIAIPNLLRSRINSNEGATKSGMKAFSTAMEAYRGSQPDLYYPLVVANLTEAIPAYLDSRWADNDLSGYEYAFYIPASGLPRYTYALHAFPKVDNVTGQNQFCVDQTGVVRIGTTTATADGCIDGDAIS